MRKLILSTTAIVMLSSSTAFALDNLETETIVAEFSTAQRIEIKRGLFRTRVEVVIDGKVIEVVYDNATFAEVNRAEEPLSQDDIDDLSDEGIEIEVEFEDELDDDDYDDDDGEDIDDDDDYDDDDGEDHDDRDDDDHEDHDEIDGDDDNDHDEDEDDEDDEDEDDDDDDEDEDRDDDDHDDED